MTFCEFTNAERGIEYALTDKLCEFALPGRNKGPRIDYMCGIAGIWRRNATVAPREIHRMSETIAHRGPDDAGHILIDTRGRLPLQEVLDGTSGPEGYDLALANRRLAIIDLSAAGHQPMTRGECTVVYNGELYNYIEIKEDLEKLGCVFTSSSDTEVLLYAYLQWGQQFLSRLNGMFAFAIWDQRTKRLFCARDRLGIKPFYYLVVGETLFFASEIKAILAVLDRNPGLNEGLVFDFLAAGLLDHTRETFFRGIEKLPPGHCLCVDGSKESLYAYWRLKEDDEATADFEDNAREFRRLLEDSVRMEMRSDVPVGCCLSGGMDSSAIVGIAASMTPYRMRTFTARYHDPSMDEWNYAEQVVKKTDVQAESVFALPEDFWRLLPELLWIQEEPFAGPAVYAQWQLMKLIRASGVSVVLDGQGADEILCGYAKFFYYYLLELWRERRVATVLATLMRATANGGAHLLQFSAAKRYLPVNHGGDNNHGMRVDFFRRNRHRSLARPGGGIAMQQRLDIENYSLPVLLRYEDKNSMSQSVESRVPFLDHRLVEFAVNLPSDHKFWGGMAKRVMRHALADTLPKEVIKRRTKLGFGGTFSSWVGALYPQFAAWINSDHEAIDPYVDRKFVNRLLDRRDPTLFLYLVLDRWLSRFGYC